ncbi:unnamed protein product [Schistosoma turkestanicum]|nr:unnamed protein product [Schistosoma turkestanicum]
MTNVRTPCHTSHDADIQLSSMKSSTSKPPFTTTTTTTTTTATTSTMTRTTIPGDNFSCLNQTIIDIENILYKNCIELNQHEAKLITLLERSEAMEKNARQFKKVNRKSNLSKLKQHKCMLNLIVIGLIILITIMIFIFINL